MKVHVIISIGISIILLACMFLPFLPGAYDPIAIPLSSMIQVFTYSGLILAPVAIFGLFTQIKRSHQIKEHDVQFHKEYKFTRTGFILANICIIIASLGAVGQDSRMLAILTIIIAVGILSLIFFLWKRNRIPTPYSFQPVIIYLFIPMI